MALLGQYYLILADPLDRALLGQAIVKGVALATADKATAGYGASVREI